MGTVTIMEVAEILQRDEVAAVVAVNPAVEVLDVVVVEVLVVDLLSLN